MFFLSFFSFRGGGGGWFSSRWLFGTQLAVTQSGWRGPQGVVWYGPAQQALPNHTTPALAPGFCSLAKLKHV